MHIIAKEKGKESRKMRRKGKQKEKGAYKRDAEVSSRGMGKGGDSYGVGVFIQCSKEP